MDTSFLTLNGRIGSLQWLAYCTAVWLLVGLLEVCYRLVTKDPLQWKYFTWMQTGLFVLLMALVSRRRLHDLGLGAPFLLGAILPFINLYFFFMMVFKAGDEGANEYGLPSAPGNGSAKLLTYMVIGVAVSGAVTGLAISMFAPGYVHMAGFGARWSRRPRFGYHGRFTSCASSLEPS